MTNKTIWAEGYEQGWRDRDAYNSAESWPFVCDTPNPHGNEDPRAAAWDACATELQDLGGTDARALAFILMSTNPYKDMT